jgi:putative transposase
VDETVIKAGLESIWLWVAIKPQNKQILALNINKEINMFIDERFIFGLIKSNGKHPISTNGRTWYSQACKFLKLPHHIHSSYEKSIIERTMHYIKIEMKFLMTIFQCILKTCKLKHALNWMNLFGTYHNKS